MVTGGSLWGPSHWQTLHFNLCLCLHVAFSPGPSVSELPLFYKDTSYQTRVHPTQQDLILT